jgi:hypothetical protein
MSVLEIALKSFVDDTKQLVSDGVIADIEHHIVTAATEEIRQVAIRRGKERRKCLKQWLKLDRPLCYGHLDDSGAYKILIGAVVADVDKISLGLPNLQLNSMPPMVLVSHLLDMSSPHSPSHPSAPVMTNGAFLPVLKEAHRRLLALSPDTAPEVFRSRLSDLFHRALNHFQIRFIPFHLERSLHPGSPHRKPVFDSWAHLGAADPTPPAPLLPYQAFPQASSSQHAADVALGIALSNDSNADWAANGLTLATLHTVLCKTCLPADWKTPTKTSVAYVDDTYTWVTANYNGARPLHHLALIVSIIASHLLPRLFLPKDTSKHLFEHATSPKEVHHIYNTLAWEPRPNKKGLTDKRLFVSMITTFIIALYERGSPLYQHMNQPGGKKGLGDPWTKKHCMCFAFILHIWVLIGFSHCFFLAVKGISHTTLIRLGVLWGKGTGAFEKGTFGIHWGCHSDRYIDALLDSLLKALRVPGSPFGPYDALAILIGDQNARFFCRDHLGFSCRPPPPLATSVSFTSGDDA